MLYRSQIKHFRVNKVAAAGRRVPINTASLSRDHGFCDRTEGVRNVSPGKCSRHVNTRGVAGAWFC